MDDTEDYIAIDQDSHRNQLIQLDVLATAGMISLSFITVRRPPLPNLAPTDAATAASCRRQRELCALHGLALLLSIPAGLFHLLVPLLRP